MRGSWIREKRRRVGHHRLHGALQPNGGTLNDDDSDPGSQETRGEGGDGTGSVGPRSTDNNQNKKNEEDPTGGIVETTDTSVVITGLTDGVEYSVRVLARNAIGESPLSDSVIGTPGQATEPLEAEFPSSPFSSWTHSGTDDRPQVVVAFSRPVASFTASTPSVSVAGGTLLSGQAHEEPGLENAYILFLDPAGTDAIQFNLVPNEPCDSGGICSQGRHDAFRSALDAHLTGTGDGEHAGHGRAHHHRHSPGGQDPHGGHLGIEDDDGVANAVFTYQWLADDAEIAGADGSSYTLADADETRPSRQECPSPMMRATPMSLTSEATAAVVSAAGPLAGFTLVDASDQTVVDSLTNGAALTLEDPANGSYGIRVDTETGAEIGSVRLELSGAKTVSQTENYAPYPLYGDDNDGLHGEGLPAGAYTLRATAYSETWSVW